MKILHTSDWHLGRGLGDYELYEDQEAAIKFIVDEAISHKANVLVVAGDVFDRGTPPPRSIKLLNQALTRLNEAGIVSIVTAGNHDNAERLSAYSNLLTENVHIWGSITDTGKPILVNDEHGLVAFYPITYLYPDKSIETFEELGQGKVERSHQAVHEHAMNLIRANFEELKKASADCRLNSAESAVLASILNLKLCGSTDIRCASASSNARDFVLIRFLRLGVFED
jgi:exonuclease SbcD